jgi:hypothetical protein
VDMVFRTPWWRHKRSYHLWCAYQVLQSILVSNWYDYFEIICDVVQCSLLLAGFIQGLVSLLHKDGMRGNSLIGGQLCYSTLDISYLQKYCSFTAN